MEVPAFQPDHPLAVPTIVNGAMWRWIYNADFGSLNGLLMQFG